jgi:hypothetical protein
LIKTLTGGGTALVRFELPSAVSAGSVSVCGDFNDWSPQAQPLARLDTGGFHAVLELPTGCRWRFRYLLDGGRWENDWAADDYIPNDHGSHDSVVDLTPSALAPQAAPDATSPSEQERTSSEPRARAATLQAPTGGRPTTSGAAAKVRRSSKPQDGGVESSPAPSPRARARKAVAAESSDSPAAAPRASARARKAVADSAAPSAASGSSAGPSKPAGPAPSRARKAKEPLE